VERPDVAAGHHDRLRFRNSVDGHRSMNVREAKDFLVQQTANQAERNGVPLSELEKRSKCSGRPLGLCGRRLPELNLIPIQVIDPGKATVGFIHSFGVNLYSLLF
jgi:hypothetical protein